MAPNTRRIKSKPLLASTCKALCALGCEPLRDLSSYHLSCPRRAITHYLRLSEPRSPQALERAISFA